jgi:hypothetical protein
MSKRNTVEIKPRPTEVSDAQDVAYFVTKTTVDTFGPNVKDIGKITELM